MKFLTTRFGEIDFPQEVVMTFPEGILGFPAEQRYILLEHDADGSPFKWLQSIDNADLAFIVVDPLDLEPDYAIDIDIDTARHIGTANTGDCALMCIVNIPRHDPSQMTVNLKAPVVVNVENRNGRQVILSNNAYAIGTPLFRNFVAAQEPMRAVS